MFIKRYICYLFICFLPFVITCEKPRKKSIDELPSVIKDLKNVTIHTFDQQVDTVEFIEEVRIESNENVFLDGTLWKTKVDDSNNVFIAVQRLGKLGIYAFNQNGEVLTVLGRYGRGPGEFESISSMAISNDTLWVLDTRLQKIGMFSLKDFSHIRDELIDDSKIKNEGKFTSMMKGKDLYAIDSDNLLIKFAVLSLFEPNLFTRTEFYRVSRNGEISPQKVLIQDRYSAYLFEDKISGRELGFTAPFTRSSLFTVNEEGDLFAAWNENFLIKKYSTEGDYQEAFHYSFKKSNLSLENLDLDPRRKEFIEEQGYPKTWPALHTLEADDEGRLWVATITESDSTFQWFVLDQKNGDLLAKFTFKGSRSKLNPFANTSATIIKNGYFYTREYDYNAGIDRIIKYKIVFKRESNVSKKQR